MHISHFWNLLHLYSYQAFLILLLAGGTLSSSLQAQSTKGNYNYLDFQQKPYYFGITLATNTADYRLFRSNNFITDSIASVSSVKGPGFNLGIVSNLKIGQNFDFRFMPTLSFAERTVEFTSLRGERLPDRRVESVFVEFPFHVRYKSAPYRDMRVFVIAGVKYSFDVASESRSRDADNLISIAPNDFALEYGGGIQFFFPYFIFSPEFKVSHGMGNVLLYDERFNENQVIEKILSRAFTISFHFEG